MVNQEKVVTINGIFSTMQNYAKQRYTPDTDSNRSSSGFLRVLLP